MSGVFDDRDYQSGGGFQWQKERRRPGWYKTPNAPVQGFAPGGVMTLWLPVPLTRKSQELDPAGKVVPSFKFNDQKDLRFDVIDRELQNQIGGSVVAAGGRVSVPRDLLHDYARRMIDKTYMMTEADYAWLLPGVNGAKWIVPVLQHALGGEAVCSIAGRFPAGGILHALEGHLATKAGA